jgi:heme exporter protein D
MNWAEFFSMGGRGFYVWGSYGAFAVGIALEIAFLRLRARRARHNDNAAATTGGE